SVFAPSTLVRIRPIPLPPYRHLFFATKGLAPSVPTLYPMRHNDDQREFTGGGMFIGRLRNSVSILALFVGSSAVAGETPMVAVNTNANDNSVFNLGEIEQVTITGAAQSQAIGEVIVTPEDIYKFNALT